MADVRAYLLVEALNVSDANRDMLFNAMRAILGRSGTQPAYLNHSRTRLDGDAIIIEALFDEDDISIAQTKQYLADVFGILASLIGNANDNQNPYGFESVFSYPLGVTDRIRYIAFGYDGGWSDWETCRLAAKAYIIANNADWNGA